VLPTSEGVWRWKRNDDGREFDLPVYNVGRPMGEWYLKVLFLKVYHDLDVFLDGRWIAKVSHDPDSYVTKQIAGWVHPDDVVEERRTCTLEKLG
jgi:hypothetical protein